MSRTARLSVAERKADEAMAAVRHAEQLWSDAYTVLLEALRGSTRHDLADEWAALGADDDVDPEDPFGPLVGVFAAWRKALDALLARLGEPLPSEAVRSGTAPPAAVRARTPRQRPDAAQTLEPAPARTRQLQPEVVDHATARDGSRYPAQAQWAVDDLPRRVRRGAEGEKTVGRVRVGEIDHGTMTSGRDGTWTPAVDARMARLGIVTPMRLGRHVEMKAAQLLVDTPAAHAELVINHQTCGSPGFQLDTAACHQVLPRYLPRGKTLTVYGTTADGLPFAETYEGHA
ncbi:DddA-like double-stranded DNA deaminase toxin [Saccharothrix luteola]|uniref:DddA-like double-stranded DNA deaminase toxin n=1 Tax=Saccharothrix luteola TaxID=2893018 RepID=UPI001E5BB9E0|nr:DddA-like double-stranded DNA deaminase toxin [Saccharothrix luteola]MCC8250540.1 hypothetical protein [Saccharothrix luteola]